MPPTQTSGVRTGTPILKMRFGKVMTCPKSHNEQVVELRAQPGLAELGSVVPLPASLLAAIKREPPLRAHLPSDTRAGNAF